MAAISEQMLRQSELSAIDDDWRAVSQIISEL
jgi:hypothetical protein